MNDIGRESVGMAMTISHAPNTERFIWDAYMYAESPMPSARKLCREADLAVFGFVESEVVLDYIIDINSGRCQPITHKPVRRLRAKND